MNLIKKLSLALLILSNVCFASEAHKHSQLATENPSLTQTIGDAQNVNEQEEKEKAESANITKIFGKLLVAALNGDEKIFNELLSKELVHKIAIEQSIKGIYLINVAISRKNLSIIQTILKYKEILVPLANKNSSPLHEAARVGDIEIFKLLMPHYQSLLQDRYTPLRIASIAADNNNFEIINLLTEYDEKITPLHLAAASGNIQAFRKFLPQLLTFSDNQKIHIARIAATYNNLTIFDILKEHANLQTRLYYVAECSGDPKLIKECIDEITDPIILKEYVNKRDSQGNNALLVFLNNCRKPKLTDQQCKDSITILLDAGSSIDSALEMAIFVVKPICVKTILEHKNAQGISIEEINNCLLKVNVKARLRIAHKMANIKIPKDEIDKNIEIINTYLEEKLTEILFKNLKTQKKLQKTKSTSKPSSSPIFETQNKKKDGKSSSENDSKSKAQKRFESRQKVLERKRQARTASQSPTTKETVSQVSSDTISSVEETNLPIISGAPTAQTNQPEASNNQNQASQSEQQQNTNISPKLTLNTGETETFSVAPASPTNTNNTQDNSNLSNLQKSVKDQNLIKDNDTKSIQENSSTTASTSIQPEQMLSEKEKLIIKVKRRIEKINAIFEARFDEERGIYLEEDRFIDEYTTERITLEKKLEQLLASAQEVKELRFQRKLEKHQLKEATRIKQQNNQMALITAIETKDRKRFAELVNKNNVNAFHKGSPLLKLAILADKGGDLEIIKSLLEHGANPNVYDESNIPPVEYALQVALTVLNDETSQIANLLISVSKDVLENNFKGHALACLAAKHKRYAFVDLLIKSHSNPTGNSLLHYACLFGNVRMVNHLIEQGADITAKNYEGFTPLELAQNNNRKSVVNYFKEKEKINLAALKFIATLIAENLETGFESYSIEPVSLRSDDAANTREDQIAKLTAQIAILNTKLLDTKKNKQEKKEIVAQLALLFKQRRELSK